MFQTDGNERVRDGKFYTCLLSNFVQSQPAYYVIYAELTSPQMHLNEYYSSQTRPVSTEISHHFEGLEDPSYSSRIRSLAVTL